MSGKKVSGTFCAKHPEGEFIAKGTGHFFPARSLASRGKYLSPHPRSGERSYRRQTVAVPNGLEKTDSYFLHDP